MSLELVKAKLLARIELTKKLIVFIDNALANKIPKDELDAFYIDIFSQKGGHPSEVLPSLKKALNSSLNTYEKMITMCNHGNKPVSLAQLDLSLEYDGLAHEQLIKSFTAQHPSFAKCAKYLNEEKIFFDGLRCLIKPHWPAFYRYFREHFHFRLMNVQFKQFQQHRVQQSEYQLDMVFDYEKAAKDAFGLFPKRYQKFKSDLSTAEGKKITEIIAKLSEATEHYIALARKCILKNRDDYFSNLAANAAGFYQVVLKIQAEFSMVYEMIMEKNQRENSQKEVAVFLEKSQQTFNKLCKLFESQQVSFEITQKDFTSVKDVTIDLLLQKIAIAQKVITSKTSEMKNNLDILNHQPLLEIEEFTKLKQSINFSSVLIKKVINERAQYIKEYILVSKEWLEKKQLDELLAAKQEKEEFILAQKNLLMLWKSQVEGFRQAKEKEKNVVKLSPSVDIQDKSQSTIEIEGIVKLLKTLSDKWIVLIKGIFCKAKGITYPQVYYLVTNQLGGKIIEHGGGSSHKTMILRNFATEFVTEQALPETIKSGVCKPHGKAHQSGELCGFNLELIQEGLIKARITPEVIDALEQEQLNDKFKKITL